MDQKNKVPYISQYANVQDKYLALTSCGMVSLYMVLLHFKSLKKITISQTLEQMITLGRETRGGYQEGIGWVHDYFVSVAKQHGLNAYRKEKIACLDEIDQSLTNGNPVIISVEQRCLSRIGLHMIVLTDIHKTDSGEIKGFSYNDPAVLLEKDGVGRYCTKEDLIKYWRAKAIFFSAK